MERSSAVWRTADRASRWNCQKVQIGKWKRLEVCEERRKLTRRRFPSRKFRYSSYHPPKTRILSEERDGALVATAPSRGPFGISGSDRTSRHSLPESRSEFQRSRAETERERAGVSRRATLESSDCGGRLWRPLGRFGERFRNRARPALSSSEHKSFGLETSSHFPHQKKKPTELKPAPERARISSRAPNEVSVSNAGSA